MTRKGFSAAIAAALAALLAASCQQIFTTSLVKGLARDPSSYKFPADLAVSDAAYYLAQSQGDPAVAAALVTPLFNAASSGSFNQAAPLLAQAVIQSSGFEQGLSAVVGEILSSSGAPDFEALLAAFSSVSLGNQAWSAIDLIAGTNPLTSPLSAEQAYTLAIVAFIDLVNEDPSIDIGDPSTFPPGPPSTYFAGPQWDTIDAMFTYAGSVPNGQGSQLAQAMQDFIDALGGI